MSGLDFKTKNIWKTMSRYWSFYEDRDQHSAVWDTASKVLNGLHTKAFQTFYSKSIKDVPVGYNASLLNGKIEHGLFDFGSYIGDKKINLPLSKNTQPLLPLRFETEEIWINDAEKNTFFKIFDNEYYHPDLKNFTSTLPFFTETNDSFLLDASDNDMIFSSDVVDIKTYGDLIFVKMADKMLRIFKIDVANKKANLFFQGIPKNQDNTNINIFEDFFLKNDMLYIAAGTDGVAVYEVDKVAETFTRVNPDHSFAKSIGRIAIDGNILFASTSEITSTDQDQHIYIVDATNPRSITSNPASLIQQTSLTNPTGQDGGILYMTARQHILSVIRESSATYILEQYVFTDYENISLVTLEEKIERPTNSTLTLFKHISAVSLFVFVFNDGVTQYVRLYDVKNPKAPSLWEEIQIPVSKTITSIDLSFDLNTLILSVDNGVVLESSNYIGSWNAKDNLPPLNSSGGGGNSDDFYIVSVKGNTVLDLENEWEVGDLVYNSGASWVKYDRGFLLYDVTEFGNSSPINEKAEPVLTNNIMIASPSFSEDFVSFFDPVINKVRFFSHDFSHRGNVFHTFDDLTELAPGFFNELNLNLYDHILSPGIYGTPRGFTEMLWSITYDPATKEYTFDITDPNYIVPSFAPDPTDHHKLFDDDKLFSSKAVEIDEDSGDILRLRNNGTNSITINSTPYSLDFEWTMAKNVIDPINGPEENKVIIKPDLGKVNEAILTEIQNNGLTGKGFKLYRNFTLQAVTLRDSIPIPFKTPTFLAPGLDNVPQGGSLFFVAPIKKNDTGQVPFGFVIYQRYGALNLKDEMDQEFAVSAAFSNGGADFGSKVTNPSTEGFYVLPGQDTLKGRYKVESAFKDLLFITIEEQDSGAAEDEFKVSPSKEFLGKFTLSSPEDDMISDGKKYSGAFVTGEEKVYIRGTNMSNLKRVDIKDFIGKVIFFSSSSSAPDLTSGNQSSWFIVVDGYGGDENNDGYIILAKNTNDTEIYIPTTTTLSGAGEGFFVYEFKNADIMRPLSLAASRDNVVDGGYYKVANILFGVYFTFIGFPNEEGNFFQNIYELKDAVLDDVTKKTPKTFQLYDEERDGENIDKKYSEHEGIIMFSYDPGVREVFAELAFENKSILDKIYAPIVEGKHNERKDSEEYKLEIAGQMYSFSHGSNINPVEVGLTIFTKQPVNISKRSTVLSFTDRKEMTVQDRDLKIYTVDLNGHSLKPTIFEGVTLEPYQPLTNAIEIKDDVIEPRWWDRDYIEILSPHVSQRNIPNITKAQRRVINEVLKNNTFGVKINANVLREDGGTSLSRINEFIKEIKPSYSYAVVYTKLDLEDETEILDMEDSLDIELTIRVQATIFANNRNLYTTDDSAYNSIEHEMGRQNSFLPHDMVHMRIQKDGDSAIYGWSEEDGFFILADKSSDTENKHYLESGQFIFKLV